LCDPLVMKDLLAICLSLSFVMSALLLPPPR
jgi:hypothetical protein